jgi:hypothetical protein
VFVADHHALNLWTFGSVRTTRSGAGFVESTVGRRRPGVGQLADAEQVEECSTSSGFAAGLQQIPRTRNP